MSGPERSWGSGLSVAEIARRRASVIASSVTSADRSVMLVCVVMLLAIFGPGLAAWALSLAGI